jgi:dipeptidyl aminopeptidase/acylaminoacyl peptidase
MVRSYDVIVRTAGVVAMLVVALAVTPGAGAGEPQGTLAFSCGGICLISADGSGRTAVGNGPAADHDAAWSPDGRRLAFVSDRQGDNAIYVMDADGRNVRRLTPVGVRALQPSWSRTNEIAFSGQSATGESGVFLIGADGGDLREVFANNDPRVLWAEDPAISPDGSRIAFTGTQIATVTNQHPTDGIYLMGTNGTAPVRVAAGDAPAWSHDGSRLAFIAPNSNNIPELRVTNADGSGLRTVTSVAGCIQNLRPAWSPDGGWLAYIACPASSMTVDVVPSAGGTPTTVTFAATGGGLDWRPVTPSSGLASRIRFVQRACSTHPGRASVTVTDKQARAVAAATVTIRGGVRIRPASGKTNATGTTTILLQPTHAQGHGRLYLTATVRAHGRPTLTKKLSLPACG